MRPLQRTESEEKEGHRKNNKSLTKTDLRALALRIMHDSEELKKIHSQVVQNGADRVHSGFRNYLDGRARFPRAKKYKDCRLLTYPQSGFKLNGEVVEKEKKRTEIRGGSTSPRIGQVRNFLHRRIKGRIKRLTIKYEARE